MSTDNSLAQLITVDRSAESVGWNSGTASDTLLQASRRIDWRFLLPSPVMQNVAYVGLAQPELLKSLRLYSQSLTIIETDQAEIELRANYDVVVASAPSDKLLKKAAKLVKPGGFLYVETYGLFGFAHIRPRATWRTVLSKARLCSSTKCVAVLESLDFIQIEEHWHWPSFEACTKIIPLQPQSALTYALTQNPNTFAARLITALGRRRLPQTGLVARLIPCYSILAQRDQE